MKLNFGKLIPIESNNVSSINEDCGPYITNKNFYQHKKFDEINNINETNKIAPILKLSEVETLIETSRESSKNLSIDKLSLNYNLINKKNNIEKQQRENKKNEMSRIFNEYLENDTMVGMELKKMQYYML